MNEKILDQALYSLVPADVRMADSMRRHDAFWGPLDGRRRVCARVACDFFATMGELNRQQYIFNESGDETLRRRAHRLSLELAAQALSQFRHFSELTCAADKAAAIEKLDRLIDYSETKGWTITPKWWRKSPVKDTRYFISRLEVFSEMRDCLLGEIRREVEKRNSERVGKGGAR